jgi:hypothetical protein
MNGPPKKHIHIDYFFTTVRQKKAFNFLRSSRAGFYFFCSRDKNYKVFTISASLQFYSKKK